MTVRAGDAATGPDGDMLALARRAVEKWRPRLHLAEWRIDVAIGEVKNDRLCEVIADPDRAEAAITLPADFEQRARAYYAPIDDAPLARIVELSVVHELLHVAEEPWHDRFVRALADRLGPLATGDALWRSWLDYREEWVTRLSVVLLEADDGDWTAEPTRAAASTPPSAPGSGADDDLAVRRVPGASEPVG